MSAQDSVTVEIYRGRKRFRQAWRWRAIAANGKIIATSGEAYTNLEDIQHIVGRLFAGTEHKIVLAE